MRKIRILLVGCLFVVATCSLGMAATPEEILASMTTQEKIAQLLIPAYRKVSGGTTDDITVLCAEVAEIISTYPFAGVILYGENLTANDAGTLLIHQLQLANVSNDERPQLLIMTDQEGGLVARLGHSTAGISPMALGATGNPEHTRTIAKLIGGELKALGINSNLAPVADIPTDPHTDPIGLRAFGSSPDIVAAHTRAYLTGLREAGVLNCVKHFPGMGSASANTDGNSDPVTIDRSKAVMDACELLPYRQAIAAGLVDMVMTSHASYSQLESRTFVASDGGIYTLPASLSPAIVTGLLREELHFDGLVVADALLGTMITHHFTPVQVLQLALEAGVDVLPYAVELNQSSSVAALKTAMATFAAQVDADDVWRARLDVSVQRILTFKAKHGLLTPYALDDAQAQAQAQLALQTVSNQENHRTQWSIALDAVTLVDHQEGTLPLDPDTRVAVLYYYASQQRSVQYGLEQLVAAGQLTQLQADSVKILDVHADDLAEELADVETVVILSSVYYESELNPDSPSPYSDEITIVLPLLETLREQDIPVIVASCHLPFDIGLYYGQVAAIPVGYLANGISTTITTLDNQPRYGVMVAAIIYKLYDRQSDFHGRLPVDVPAVADGAYLPGSILLPCGYGLQLASTDEDTPTDDDQPEDEQPPATDDTPITGIPSSGGGCQLSPAWWSALLLVGFAIKRRRH